MFTPRHTPTSISVPIPPTATWSSPTVSILIILNLFYRASPDRVFIPYVGIGVGAAVPHVEVTLKGVPGRTYEYQLTGLAAQAFVGIEHKLGDKWSVFAEAKVTYAQIDAELSGGGSLNTQIWSPHVAVGLTYRFDTK